MVSKAELGKRIESVERAIGIIPEHGVTSIWTRLAAIERRVSALEGRESADACFNGTPPHDVIVALVKLRGAGFTWNEMAKLFPDYMKIVDDESPAPDTGPTKDELRRGIWDGPKMGRPSLDPDTARLERDVVEAAKEFESRGVYSTGAVNLVNAVRSLLNHEATLRAHRAKVRNLTGLDKPCEIPDEVINAGVRRAVVDILEEATHRAKGEKPRTATEAMLEDLGGQLDGAVEQLKVRIKKSPSQFNPSLLEESADVRKKATELAGLVAEKFVTDVTVNTPMGQVRVFPMRYPDETDVFTQEPPPEGFRYDPSVLPKQWHRCPSCGVDCGGYAKIVDGKIVCTNCAPKFSPRISTVTEVNASNMPDGVPEKYAKGFATIGNSESPSRPPWATCRWKIHTMINRVRGSEWREYRVVPIDCQGYDPNPIVIFRDYDIADHFVSLHNACVLSDGTPVRRPELAIKVCEAAKRVVPFVQSMAIIYAHDNNWAEFLAALDAFRASQEGK